MFEFGGRFSEFKNFCVRDKCGDNDPRYDITIRQLMVHSSGLPFQTWTSPEKITGAETRLFFAPDEGWAYSLGPRVLGWLLKDYWVEKKPAGLQGDTVEAGGING